MAIGATAGERAARRRTCKAIIWVIRKRGIAQKGTEIHASLRPMKDWDTGLSPCKLCDHSSSCRKIQRSMWVSLQLHGHPFDSLHSGCLSPSCFATPEIKHAFNKGDSPEISTSFKLRTVDWDYRHINAFQYLLNCCHSLPQPQWGRLFEVWIEIVCAGWWRWG